MFLQSQTCFPTADGIQIVKAAPSDARKERHQQVLWLSTHTTVAAVQ
jgi:hypothetical protein